MSKRLTIEMTKDEMATAIISDMRDRWTNTEREQFCINIIAMLLATEKTETLEIMMNQIKSNPQVYYVMKGG